jgi:hypothetical protein
LLNSGKIALLDHPRLIAQLCGLERRTARSGKDSIDHAPGAHDDLANAVAGALVRVEASRRAPQLLMSSLPMNRTDYSAFGPEPCRQKRYRVDPESSFRPGALTRRSSISFGECLRGCDLRGPRLLAAPSDCPE